MVMISRIICATILVATLTTTQAQTMSENYYRKVSTKGYSEKEVTPDIIYLSISLKEYYKDGNTKKKVEIEGLEKQLYEAAIKNGVSKDDFTIQNIYSYNYETKKKNNELLQARQYRLKITNLNNLNTLLDELDPKGLQSTSISGYDHSNKKELEKQLKVDAVKDAINNANILAEASGNKIGKTLVISDNSNINFNEIMVRPQMAYAKMADSAIESEALNIDIKPIKLTCYVDAIFELL